MTVVGYGDSESMPNLKFTEQHNFDWTNLSVIMLIGLLVFAYIRNNLELIIGEQN